MALPKDLATRPAMMDDAEAAGDLVNACSVEQIGQPEWRADQFRRNWQPLTLSPDHRGRRIGIIGSDTRNGIGTSF